MELLLFEHWVTIGFSVLIVTGNFEDVQQPTEERRPAADEGKKQAIKLTILVL